MIAVLLLACGPRVGAAEPPVAPVPVVEAPGPKEMSVSNLTFVDGPAILPADALLAWLQKAGTKRIRLPVQVTSDALGVTRATVGTSPDALSLSLDSGALSMTLQDHLHRHCGDESPCFVWLEGTWGPLMALGPPRPGHVFAVRGVVGKVAASDPLVARLQE